LVFVLKVLIVAAILAALAVGGLIVARVIQRRFGRRPGSEVMTLTARR
jgi:uncharacterized protein YneF (UPF0154 family)